MAETKKKKAASTKKTTKTARKTPIKKIEVIPEPIEEMPVTIPLEEPGMMEKKPATKMKKTPIVLIIIVIIVIGLLYKFRGQFIVATVNGQPISRLTYNAELEKEAGKKSMDALVTKILILQEAKKENVSVSDQEVNDQIKKIEAQLKGSGQTLDQALATQGMTMADLKDQVKIEQLIEKMLGKQIAVSDKEVDDYMQKMQQANGSTDSGASPTPPQMSKDQIKEQLKQQKLSEKVQPWIADLQAKAKINYFINQ